jgi:fermentation-respiration switch protein FrsA (DUF1100 family)
MSTSDTTQTGKSRLKLLWRIARPVLLVYLLIVLAMALLESSLVYPIPPLDWGNWHPTSFEFENVHFMSADRTKLHGWFIPHSDPTRAILYCHGNGEDVAALGEYAAHLSESLAASVFIFDYRGYGNSDGRPNEAGCIADGSAAQFWLAGRMAIKPNEVILMGRSLGSAVAVALAADNGARALVLENAFPTMPDVAASYYPWLPVRWVMDNRYDNLARIQRYKGPLLQSHGTNDELIPMAAARRLFDASPTTTKKWLEFPGLGHNSPQPASYYVGLKRFLDPLSNPVHHDNVP